MAGRHALPADPYGRKAGDVLVHLRSGLDYEVLSVISDGTERGTQYVVRRVGHTGRLATLMHTNEFQKN